jgi:hypothetical protein
MRSQKMIYKIVLLLIMALISSCWKTTNISGTLTRETAPTPQGTMIYPTNISTELMNSATPIITILPTVTSIPTSTSALTPQLTESAILALSVEDARIRLEDLLMSNGNCKLPCIWGITPGKSTLQEARIILEPLKNISDFMAFAKGIGNLTPNFTEKNTGIYTNFDFLTSNNIVSYVVFRARAFREDTGGNSVIEVFDSDVYGKYLFSYMLPQILTKYGRPSDIRLKTLTEPPSQSRGGDIGYFNVVLIYPEEGILVNYNTDIHNLGDKVNGCMNNAHVTLSLYPADKTNSFWENLDPSLKEDIQFNYKPIEDVTSLSINDFYNTFSQPTEECITTPANLWPIPEK